jgi:hypothetical protein
MLCLCDWLAPGSAQASDLVILGGMNLSSPLTAHAVSYNAYLGITTGVGLDMNMGSGFFAEIDLLYLSRRYSATYTIPTFEFPLIFKYEFKFLYGGAGPYLATNIGSVISDGEGPATSTDELGISSLDYGAIVEGGLKFPVHNGVYFFLDGRISRALNDSSDGQGFHWGQIQAYFGIRVPMHSRHQK